MNETEIKLLADLLADRLASHKLAYNVRTAAEACGVKESTIRQAISSGTLAANKIGQSWIIRKEALSRWLQG